jgi:fructokinase
MTSGSDKIRIGIDVGGTKIEGLALDGSGTELARHRIVAPTDNYRATIDAIAELVSELARDASEPGGSKHSLRVGLGIPGSVSPKTGKIQNANSTWLNGQALQKDLEAALVQPVRLANDANCFALSEAVDGAGAVFHSVFGVILGTGVGGGLIFRGSIINGPRSTGGEWGHNPLPWPQSGEHPGPRCWCGRQGCIETWVSGPAMAWDHEMATGERISAETIAAKAADGDGPAAATLERHCDRLARGLAHVINVFDPDVVVLGGGLSKLSHLYRDLPGKIAPHLFTDAPEVRVLPPRWGDASGVRGAAWLWD